MTPYNPTERNPQAMAINRVLKEKHRNVFDLLSLKGKAMYFPKYGILKQGADAKGKRINATIGMAMDEQGKPLCLKTMADAVNIPHEDVFLYASSYGVAGLREAWKKMIYRKNPSLNADISIPVVTSGLTHGLSRCAYTFFDPEDEIIIPYPFWGNYNLVFANEHYTKMVGTPFFKNNRLNLKGIMQTLNDIGEKKGLLLNFPNNPSGYTPTVQEVDEIVSIIGGAADRGKKIVVLIDDAYFGLVYKKGIYEESIFAKLADFHENVLAVKIDGATKEDYSWGLRVGFLTFGIKGAHREVFDVLEDKIAGSLRGNISNVPMISQTLVLNSMKSERYTSEKHAKYDIMKRRFQKVDSLLSFKKEYRKYFTPLPYNSGYFMCIKLFGYNAEEVRQVLLRDYSTGVISITDDIIRIAYSSTPLDLIEELFDNICSACRDISDSSLKPI